jgi:membrane-associated phospholipid phosphatase
VDADLAAPNYHCLYGGNVSDRQANRPDRAGRSRNVGSVSNGAATRGLRRRGLVILALNPLLKTLVGRARPSAAIVGANAPLNGLGFPSGHAYQSVVLFGFFVVLAAIFVKRIWLRRSIQVFLAFLILAIGVSRIYLGAHWPSDILGAYLLGGSLLGLLLRSYQARLPDTSQRMPL